MQRDLVTSFLLERFILDINWVALFRTRSSSYRTTGTGSKTDHAAKAMATGVFGSDSLQCIGFELDVESQKPSRIGLAKLEQV